MPGTLCLGYGRRVYADCAPSGPAGTYACSGSTTTTQSLSPAPAAAPLSSPRPRFRHHDGGATWSLGGRIGLKLEF
jgi:hypothetical protein